MFQKINKIIPHTPLAKNKKEFLVFKKLLKIWEKKINKNIQKHTELVDYVNGVVTIKTKSAIWKTELTTQITELKKNFQTTIKIKLPKSS